MQAPSPRAIGLRWVARPLLALRRRPGAVRLEEAELPKPLRLRWGRDDEEGSPVVEADDELVRETELDLDPPPDGRASPGGWEPEAHEAAGSARFTEQRQRNLTSAGQSASTYRTW